MKAKTKFFATKALHCLCWVMVGSLAVGQTLVNLGTQGRNIDFTNAPFTKPVKTGTTLPPSCSPGELFFNISAPAGQNLYGCSSTNTWTQSSSSSGTVSAAQMPAFSGDISTPAGSTTATLATVNSSPGIYGDGSHTVQLTVDGKGRVTGISQVAIAGDNGNSPISAGPLASISSACTPGTLYLATDQAAGQQIYTCSATNTWTQIGSVGPSGALAVTNGSLDIVPSVVPLLPAANTFTGLNTFANGIQIQATSTQPSCGSAVRGLVWFVNSGSSKDSVQVCVYTGSSFAWINLY